MKKSFIIGLMAVFFLSLAMPTQAQNSEISEKQGIVKKNAIRLSWTPQLSYDRLLWQKGKHHIGATIGTFALYQNYDRGFGFSTETFWRSLSTIGFYHLYGKRKHYLETSFLYGLASNQFRGGEWAAGKKHENGTYQTNITDYNLRNNPEIRSMIEKKQDFRIDNTFLQTDFYHWASARIGYRYQNPEGGFVFKAGWGFFNYFPNGNKEIHWGIVEPVQFIQFHWFTTLDLSLGWSF